MTQPHCLSRLFRTALTRSPFSRLASDTAYFKRLGLSEEEAAELHHRYYTEYGLAIRGLVRHHKVDPLDYDKHCDAALPLETVLAPNPRLQQMLKDIDRTKVRVWALTNAYVNVSSRSFLVHVLRFPF